MNHAPSTHDPVDRVLRWSRRSLVVVLVMLFIAAATLIAHALRPGSLLADWPSKAPWLIPTAAAILATTSGLLTRGHRAPAEEAKRVLRRVVEDEFRQTNLARAQRLALMVVVVAQAPLAALALSGLTTAAAVTVMSVTTAMLGIGTVIVSFLVFDRE